MNAGAKAPHLAYGRPCIEEDDIAAVAKVLRSGWLTTGPLVEQFETALAAQVGASHAIVCNSGTAALHLAVMALGLDDRSTVIVPAITFAATANAARYAGARVVFCDVDPHTGLMTPETLEAALARVPRPDAVFPVHLNGQCVALPDIHEIAERHRLAIVEDACHALGTRYQDGAGWRRVGESTHSDYQCFSFHPVKTVAMGEGGAVTTCNATAARRMRNLRSHGIERSHDHFEEHGQAVSQAGEPNAWYYELQELGFNYRASDIQCALGLSQLAKLARFKDARARLVEAYDARLRGLAPWVRPIGRVGACDPAWHLYVAQIDFAALGTTRALVMQKLASLGIGTQVHYLPVPYHPYYRSLDAQAPEGMYPGADAYYAKCLSLPLYVGMTPGDVARVVDALQTILP